MLQINLDVQVKNLRNPRSTRNVMTFDVDVTRTTTITTEAGDALVGTDMSADELCEWIELLGGRDELARWLPLLA